MNSKFLYSNLNSQKCGLLNLKINKLIFMNRNLHILSKKNIKENRICMQFQPDLIVQINSFKTLNNFIKNQLLKANVMSIDQFRTKIKGGPGYTNFGHGRPKPKLSNYAYFYYVFLAGGIIFSLFFDFDTFFFKEQEPEEKMNDFKSRFNRSYIPKAKEISNEENIKVDEQSIKNNDDVESDDDSKSNKKAKSSFRIRKIIEYENRIRQYSTPDKVFRYFATIKVWNEKTNESEVYMTPDDFVRSLTYGVRQPDGLGLDSFNKFDPKMQNLDLQLGENSVFKRLNPHGLISFSDYILLVTLLSTPTRHFEIAFQMFDLDGNGNIDIGEWQQLQTIIRNQTSLGQRHRDTHMTGSVIKDNQYLNEHLFGKDFSELLTVNKFIEFQKHLQYEVIKKEFEFCDLKEEKSGDQIISEVSFCEMILAYAGTSSDKIKKTLKRISNAYKDDSRGITFKDYEDFFQVLRHIQEIDTALKFYAIAGASIDKSILKHVSKTVAGVTLSDHVIEVVFNLFDENNDGKLSQREFIKVMKKRWSRGLQTPKDTGFIKFIQSLGICTKEAIFN